MRQRVVHPDELDPAAVDGVDVRVTFDSRTGCERLEQRVLRVPRDTEYESTTGEAQEVLYIAGGRATLAVGDARHDLVPDTGVYLPPDTAYAVRADDDLTIVAVTAPDAGGAPAPRAAVVSFADQEELEASPERTFRYLADEGDLTQFIGIVQPSNAPVHSHPYDELGYIVEGVGIAHVGGADIPLRPGSCFHLPPGELHSIENSGEGPMRILGVFHPSDSPASRSYPDNN